MINDIGLNLQFFFGSAKKKVYEDFLIKLIKSNCLIDNLQVIIFSIFKKQILIEESKKIDRMNQVLDNHCRLKVKENQVNS